MKSKPSAPPKFSEPSLATSFASSGPSGSINEERSRLRLPSVNETVAGGSLAKHATEPTCKCSKDEWNSLRGRVELSGKMRHVSLAFRIARTIYDGLQNPLSELPTELLSQTGSGSRALAARRLGFHAGLPGRGPSRGRSNDRYRARESHRDRSWLVRSIARGP